MRSRIVFLLLILILLVTSVLMALLTWWLSYQAPLSIDGSAGDGSGAWRTGYVAAGAGLPEARAQR